MIKRIRDYHIWMLKEVFALKPTNKIYDDIAYFDYENTIDYNTRVSYFKKTLNSLKFTPKRVLDIACGTGALIDALPNKKSAHILGIDISSGMLKTAKKRFKKFPNITFKLADFLQVDYPASSFDLITITHATRFIPKEKEKYFVKKVHKWLAPNGIFIAVLHESFINKIYSFVYALTGIPKGYNIHMEYANNFTKIMSEDFTLQKKEYLKTQFFIFHSTALHFKKK